MHWEIVVHKIDSNYAFKQLKQMTFPKITSKIKSEKLIAIAGISDHKMLGLLLLEEYFFKNHRVFSFYVRPEARNIGLGSELFQKADFWLKENSKRAYVVFQTNFKSAKVIENILSKSKWPKPAKIMKLVKVKVEDFKKAPWYKFQSLPQNYTSRTWKSLSSDQIEKLKETKKGVDPIIDPFQQEERRHEEISQILFYKDEAVGWMISHVVDGETIQRTSFYLKEEHREPFLAPAFNVKVINEQLKAGFKYSIFQFSTDNAEMNGYYKAFLEPFAFEKTEVLKSEKVYEES